MVAGDDVDLGLFTDLARRLRDAHRRVAVLADDARRIELSRRLLAITAAAKHDLVGASRRLDAFLAELPVSPTDDGARPDAPTR